MPFSFWAPLLNLIRKKGTLIIKGLLRHLRKEGRRLPGAKFDRVEAGVEYRVLWGFSSSCDRFQVWSTLRGKSKNRRAFIQVLRNLVNPHEEDSELAFSYTHPASASP